MKVTGRERNFGLLTGTSLLGGQAGVTDLPLGRACLASLAIVRFFGLGPIMCMATSRALPLPDGRFVDTVAENQAGSGLAQAAMIAVLAAT